MKRDMIFVLWKKSLYITGSTLKHSTAEIIIMTTLLLF